MTAFAARGTALLLLLLLGSAAPAAELPTVSQRNKRFDTAALDLPGPGTVRFANDDTVRHNVALRTPSGEEQTGVVQAPGDVTPIRFDQSGRYEVFCLIHPQMHMTVSVP